MADENVESVVTTADVESVQKEVDEALAKDPQRILAKRIEENLKDAGVDDANSVPDAEKDKEFEEAKSRVSKALAERNKVFKERESAKQEAESIKSEAQRMKAEAEAFSRQLQGQMAQFQRWQQVLRQDPAHALRAIGIDPEDFILSIAKAGTPEYQQMQKLQEQDRKLSEFEQWKRSQEENVKKAEEARQRAEAEAHRSKVLEDFTAKTTSDKYPNVKKALEIGLVSKKSLIEQGDDVADQYRDAVGHDCSLDEILEYIDSQFGTAISKLSGTSQVKESTKKDEPSKGASGDSLSADEAGERRALSRDLRSADSDERREAAKEAVKAVLKKTKNA